MDFLNRLAVEPGTDAKLDKKNPAATPDAGERNAAEAELEALSKRMEELQFLLYADAGKSLLVVLQGPDAAGKDGLIRKVFDAMNPQGVHVFPFKQPSSKELAHDFLWRVHKCTPARGEIAIFNRSHYEDVLIVRVRELVKKEVWSARYELINDFEKLLAANGTKILKFFLHISAEEQLERFRKRLEDKSRNWKISESDYTERKLWPDYMAAYEDMLTKTSTKNAPWYIIPSDRKWYRNLAIARIIVATLEDMKLSTPEPRVDLEDIARRYHAEVAAANGKNENGKGKNGNSKNGNSKR